MAEPPQYADRREAGSLLGERLLTLAGNWIVPAVFALPRGGVPVAVEVAAKLGAPLDVFLVRKLGMPGEPELAMGAVALGGVVVTNPEVMASNHIDRQQFVRVLETEMEELRRRSIAYRLTDRAPVVDGLDVILVDDGIATGASIKAAARAVRKQRPASLTLAVPVTCQKAAAELSDEADLIVYLSAPEKLGSVGRWYSDFPTISDNAVRRCLTNYQSRHDTEDAT